MEALTQEHMLLFSKENDTIHDRSFFWTQAIDEKCDQPTALIDKKDPSLRANAPNA